MSGDDIESQVLYKVLDGVGLITLNRPEKLNALTPPMTDRYLELLDEADRDPHVAVIVLTGAGRGFCAGADTSMLSSVGDGDLRARAQESPRDRAMRLTKPLIAAINGPVAGAGLAQALMADVRIASTTATLTTGFARFGLVAEYGSAYLLRELVGPANALDLLLTARKLAAAEAKAMGIYQFLHEPDELMPRTLDYARSIAANPGFSLRSIRNQVGASARQSWDEAFAGSLALMYESFEQVEFSSLAHDAARRSS